MVVVVVVVKEGRANAPRAVPPIGGVRAAEVIVMAAVVKSI